MRIKSLLTALILIITNMGLPAFAEDIIASVNSEFFIEAESMNVMSNNTGYTVLDDENASGGKSVYFTNKYMDSSVISEAALSFRYEINDDKTYYLWARVWAENAASDSMWLKTEDDSAWSNQGVVVSSEYIWVRLKTYTPGSGTHTLNIYPREGNLKIDKFAILSDVLKTPLGVKNESGYEVLYNSPSFKPQINKHPRVLFTKEALPDIISNAASEENSRAWQKHKEYISKNTDGKLPSCSATTTNVNHNALIYIRHYAFEYALTGNEQYGTKAINAISNYLDTIYFPNKSYYTYAGNAVYTAACVYDWCYPLLSTDVKTALVEKTINVASKYMEIGWPPQYQNAWGGHGSEKQLLRDLLAFGIAVYDEYPHIYDNVAGRIFSEYIGFRDYFYDSHKTPYGTWYGVLRFEADCWANQLMSTIGYNNLWQNKNMQYIPYWYMYMSRPDGYFMDEGDSRTNWAQSPDKSVIDTNNINIMMSSYFKDGYIKDELLRFSKINTSNTDYILWLTLNDPDLKTQNREELPLTKYFGYPSGSYIARTGWEDGINSNSVVAHFKINEVNFSDHNHWDAGGFQIYYKGNLATDSGYYQSNQNSESAEINEANTPYYLNYYRQTIAHNSMLIYDPEEPVRNFHHQTYNGENSGGQKSAGTGYPETLEEFKTSDVYQTAKVLANEVEKGTKTPDYTYLKGDLENSYSDKINGYERSFMFLNLKNDKTPAALIVFDRVETSSADYKKKWLLHSSSAPQIEGNRTIITDKTDGYNGRLICDTLLPLSDNLLVTQVGESENDYYNFDQSANWQTSGQNGSINEGGGIRTEISPIASENEDYFLNVLQVGDDSEDVIPLESTMISSETHTGVKISDRLVMFGNEKERVTKNVNYSFEGEGEYKHTITDLEEGVWLVKKDNEEYTRVRVEEDGGVAAFEGDAGVYELVYEGNRPYIVTPDEIYPGEITDEELSRMLSISDYSKVLDKETMLVCASVKNISDEYDITDFGIVASYKNSEPELQKEDCIKASSFKTDIKNKDEYDYGVLFTSDGFSSGRFYARPYVKISDGTVIYGNTLIKDIELKKSVYKKYFITNFRIE